MSDHSFDSAPKRPEMPFGIAFPSEGHRRLQDGRYWKDLEFEIMRRYSLGQGLDKTADDLKIDRLELHAHWLFYMRKYIPEIALDLHDRKMVEKCPQASQAKDAAQRIAQRLARKENAEQGASSKGKATEGVQK